MQTFSRLKRLVDSIEGEVGKDEILPLEDCQRILIDAICNAKTILEEDVIILRTDKFGYEYTFLMLDGAIRAYVRVASGDKHPSVFSFPDEARMSTSAILTIDKAMLAD